MCSMYRTLFEACKKRVFKTNFLEVLDSGLGYLVSGFWLSSVSMKNEMVSGFRFRDSGFGSRIPDALKVSYFSGPRGFWVWVGESGNNKIKPKIVHLHYFF